MPIHVSALSPTLLRYDMSRYDSLFCVSCVLYACQGFKVHLATGLLMEVNLKTRDVF